MEADDASCQKTDKLNQLFLLYKSYVQDKNSVLNH